MNKMQEARLTKLGKHLLNGGDHLDGWDFRIFAHTHNWLDSSVDKAVASREKFMEKLQHLQNELPSLFVQDNENPYTVIPRKVMCGTVGCALGEGTILFSRKFKMVLDSWKEIHVVIGTRGGWSKITEPSGLNSLQKFFGLDEDDDYNILFVPVSREEVADGYYKYDIPICRGTCEQQPKTASMGDVGNNILRYIESVKKERVKS